jgi:hypothetical protein
MSPPLTLSHGLSRGLQLFPISSCSFVVKGTEGVAALRCTGALNDSEKDGVADSDAALSGSRMYLTEELYRRMKKDGECKVLLFLPSNFCPLQACDDWLPGKLFQSGAQG